MRRGLGCSWKKVLLINQVCEEPSFFVLRLLTTFKMPN